MSPLGKRGVLELARRMKESFYAAVSGPVTMASTNIVDQWCVSSGTGAERVGAAVRMVTWNCAEIMPGEPAITVLSATTTVRLPGTPPLRVFEYICNLQRRGEWDSFVNGGPVEEVSHVATSARVHGNSVSILRPTVSLHAFYFSETLLLPFRYLMEIIKASRFCSDKNNNRVSLKYQIKEIKTVIKLLFEYNY